MRIDEPGVGAPIEEGAAQSFEGGKNRAVGRFRFR